MGYCDCPACHYSTAHSSTLYCTLLHSGAVSSTLPAKSQLGLSRVPRLYWPSPLCSCRSTAFLTLPLTYGSVVPALLQLHSGSILAPFHFNRSNHSNSHSNPLVTILTVIVTLCALSTACYLTCSGVDCHHQSCPQCPDSHSTCGPGYSRVIVSDTTTLTGHYSVNSQRIAPKSIL